MTETNSEQLSFHAWWKTSLGQAILTSEQKHLAPLWNTLNGDSLLMIGDHVQIPLIEKAPFKQKYIFSNQKSKHPPKNITMQHGSYEKFHFNEESFNVILLPHILTMLDNPKVFLKNVEKALSSEGFLIILAFNPLSFWGLWSLLTFWKKKPRRPSSITTTRLKSWLAALNLKTINQKRFFYRPPIQQTTFFKWCRFLESVGSLFHLWPGNITLFVIKKRTFGMTPLKLQWEKFSKMIPQEITVPVQSEAYHDTGR